MSGRNDLLSRCLLKEPKAQEELYMRYKAKVMGLCRRYARNKAEAEDIYQETFIRVFRSLNQRNDASSLESWIKRIAVNTALNYYHQTKRHNHIQERNGHHYPSEAYNEILSRLCDEMLIGIINELPDGYRMVFNLHEVEGYSHQEIGSMLNISEATSRSQLNRAKQALRNKLKQFGVLKYESYE